MATRKQGTIAPKRPFFLFLDAQREQIAEVTLKEHGSKNTKLLNVMAGKIWAGLSDEDKKPFYDEYKKRMDSYKGSEDRQVVLQERRQQRLEKREARVKRAKAKQVVPKDERMKQPKSGFMLYLEANRSIIRDKLGQKPHTHKVQKMAAEMWKALPDADRKVWLDQSKQQVEVWLAFLKTPEGRAAFDAYKAEASAATEIELVAMQAWNSCNSSYYHNKRRLQGRDEVDIDGTPNDKDLKAGEVSVGGIDKKQNTIGSETMEQIPRCVQKRHRTAGA